MPDLPRNLLERLKTEKVHRTRITEDLGIPRGISGKLKAAAKELGLVVERYNKAQQGEVQYHLRDPHPGEAAGALIEMPDMPEKR